MKGPDVRSTTASLVQANFDLVEASRRARLAAAAAIARSRALLPQSEMSSRAALALRLASRSHLIYGRVEGTVDGQPVIGVIRSDARVSGHRRLLKRAELVVAIGETFDDGRLVASLDQDPLTSTLTLARACDWVSSIELDFSQRHDALTAGSTSAA
jgi:hypothetical protein